MVTPFEKAMYLIEKGYVDSHTDPIKLATLIEKKEKELAKKPETKKIVNDIDTVYRDRTSG